MLPTISATATATASTVPLPTVSHDPTYYHEAGDLGKNTLWVVFIIMFISTAVFTGLSWRVAVKERLFYQLTAYITTIAAVSYFAMASGSGWEWHKYHVRDELDHDLPDLVTTHHRQVFYARYVDWLFTTPLLLLDLALLAGMNGSNIVNVLVADVIMILTGLFAAFGVTTRQKWGWYVIGWIAFLVIIFLLGFNARATAQKRGTQKLFLPLSIFTVVIWILYPIIWGISDGAHNMTPDQEVLAYAILDVLAKPVFGTWLLYSHARMPQSTVSLGGVWSDGFGPQEGTLRVGDDDEA